MELVARLNQEVKDKNEEIKLSEKKQAHIVSNAVSTRKFQYKIVQI